MLISVLTERKSASTHSHIYIHSFSSGLWQLRKNKYNDALKSKIGRLWKFQVNSKEIFASGNCDTPSSHCMQRPLIFLLGQPAKFCYIMIQKKDTAFNFRCKFFFSRIICGFIKSLASLERCTNYWVNMVNDKNLTKLLVLHTNKNGRRV